MSQALHFTTIGLTPRQLDYWTDRGYLVPDDPHPGSGTRRTWPESELAVARHMVELLAAGFTLRAAHRSARTAVVLQAELGHRVSVGVAS